MRRVPLALLLCLAGLALVIHVDPRPPNIRVLAIFVGMVAAWALAWLCFKLSFEDVTASVRWLVVGLAVLAFIALYALASKVRGGGLTGHALDYRGRPDPPANILGWMIILGAVGWIAAALCRHFIPARPLLMLSPAGISYRAAGLDLLVAWHAIEGVDALVVMGPSGFPHRSPDITVVLVSRELYEQHILPQRTFMTPPGWDRLFVPKGASMQILLPCQWFCIDPEHVREPVEARWKAFRNARTVAPPLGEPVPQARQVYGRWSIDGSLWQAMTFLVPLLGIVALLASATGLWQR